MRWYSRARSLSLSASAKAPVCNSMAGAPARLVLHDLIRIGIDEQRYLCPHGGQSATGGFDGVELADHVQETFLCSASRFSVTVDRRGPDVPLRRTPTSPRGRRGHLEIHAGVENLGQQAHVATPWPTASSFGPMDGDAIGAGYCGDQGRLNRVGIAGTARLAQGRDRFDVDAEQQSRGCIKVLRHGDVRRALW